MERGAEPLPSPELSLGQRMPEKLEQVPFFFSTLQFYTSWKSHMKHSWCLTFFCLLYLRHFLKHCPLVLFLVLLKSLKELFCCSSDKTSFHDNYWGLSISFFMHASAFLYPKACHKDIVQAMSSACSYTTSSAQLKSDHKPSPMTPITSEGSADQIFC